MHTFKIIPDFYLLKDQYSNFTEKEYEEFKSQCNDEGLNIDSIYFNEEEALELEDKFKKLVKKYDLTDHYNNLFFLAVVKHENFQVHFSELQSRYESKLRAKDLANLLLILLETHNDKAIDMVVKSPKRVVKINDQVLSRWILSLITDSIENKSFKLGPHGFNIISQLFGSSNLFHYQSLDAERLKFVSNEKLLKPSKSKKNILAEFCFYLYPYLQNYTQLRSKEGTIFSDAQLYFYFDFLNVFNLLNVKSIESDSKDYMNSLLRNSISSLFTGR